MRVTTQMLNASARRAGISMGGTSLLNYINGENTQTTQSSLLHALNATKSTAVCKTQRANYEKLEKSADSLTESLSIFLKEGEDKQVIVDAVEQMINNYNNTIKTLKNVSNPLNDFYKEMMEETVAENEEKMSAIGIMQNENGMLSMDKDKLKSADLETVKKALDGKGTFSTKLSFIAGRISDNAKANAESYSNQYGADGYSYSTSTGKYEFWG